MRRAWVLIAVWACTPCRWPSTAENKPPAAAIAVEYITLTPQARIPARYAETVQAAATDAGVPLWLAGRMLAAESNWRSDAVHVNADGSRDLGLAQLNERYIEWFGQAYNDGQAVDPFDADTSARVACRYLAALYRATGSWPGAVAAYNCGLTRYRTGDLPAITVRHVARVFGNQLYTDHPTLY